MLVLDDYVEDLKLDDIASPLPKGSLKLNAYRKINDTRVEKWEPLGLYRLIVKDHPPKKIIGHLKEEIKTKAFHRKWPITLIS